MWRPPSFRHFPQTSNTAKNETALGATAFGASGAAATRQIDPFRELVDERLPMQEASPILANIANDMTMTRNANTALHARPSAESEFINSRPSPRPSPRHMADRVQGLRHAAFLDPISAGREAIICGLTNMKEYNGRRCVVKLASQFSQSTSRAGHRKERVYQVSLPTNDLFTISERNLRVVQASREEFIASIFMFMNPPGREIVRPKMLKEFTEVAWPRNVKRSDSECDQEYRRLATLCSFDPDDGSGFDAFHRVVDTHMPPLDMASLCQLNAYFEAKAERRKVINQIFRALDTDATGYLDESKLLPFADHLKYRGANWALQFQELRSFLKVRRSRPGLSRRRFARLIDAHGDKSLTTAELHQLLSELRAHSRRLSFYVPDIFDGVGDSEDSILLGWAAEVSTSSDEEYQPRPQPRLETGNRVPVQSLATGFRVPAQSQFLRLQLPDRSSPGSSALSERSLSPSPIPRPIYRGPKPNDPGYRGEALPRRHGPCSEELLPHGPPPVLSPPGSPRDRIVSPPMGFHANTRTKAEAIDRSRYDDVRSYASIPSSSAARAPYSWPAAAPHEIMNQKRHASLTTAPLEDLRSMITRPPLPPPPVDFQLYHNPSLGTAPMEANKSCFSVPSVPSAPPEAGSRSGCTPRSMRSILRAPTETNSNCSARNSMTTQRAAEQIAAASMNQPVMLGSAPPLQAGRQPRGGANLNPCALYDYQSQTPGRGQASRSQGSAASLEAVRAMTEHSMAYAEDLAPPRARQFQTASDHGFPNVSRAPTEASDYPDLNKAITEYSKACAEDLTPRSRSQPTFDRRFPSTASVPQEENLSRPRLQRGASSDRPSAFGVPSGSRRAQGQSQEIPMILEPLAQAGIRGNFADDQLLRMQQGAVSPRSLSPCFSADEEAVATGKLLRSQFDMLCRSNAIPSTPSNCSREMGVCI